MTAVIAWGTVLFLSWLVASLGSQHLRRAPVTIAGFALLAIGVGVLGWLVLPQPGSAITFFLFLEFDRGQIALGLGYALIVALATALLLR
jgi:hypothetical protein